MPDLPSAQTAAISARAISLVAAKMVRTCTGMTATRALDPDAFQDGYQLGTVAPLTGSDQQGQRPTAAFPGKVDLAGKAASGPAKSFVGSVLARS